MTETSALAMNWRSTMLGMVILCAIIALTYLYLRNIERRAVHWLIAFASAAMIAAIPQIIGFAGAYDIWPGLTFLPTDLTLFYGPLIYFHAQKLMIGKPFTRQQWGLLVPGAVYYLYQLWAFFLLGDYKQKWSYNDAFHEPFVVPIIFLTGFGLSIWALIAIWRLGKIYRAWLKSTQSNDREFEPTWLTHIIILGAPLMALWILEYFVSTVLGFNYFDRYWLNFALLLLIFFFSMEALVRIRLAYPKMGNTNFPAPEPVSATKEHNERNWEAEGKKLRDNVIKEGWHLETDLSLQDLAQRMATNQSYISRALNRGLDTSFSDFINGLRVNHAKTLIAEEQLTMIEVALASGFGSKASFNRAFKSHAGLTPSQFRAQIGSSPKLLDKDDIAPSQPPQ